MGEISGRSSGLTGIPAYFNWRAYLDFARTKSAICVRSHIDIVHMLMGHTILCRGCFRRSALYKDGPDSARYDQPCLAISSDCVVTFEATLAPGSQGSGLIFLARKAECRSTGPARADSLLFNDSPRCADGGNSKSVDPTIDHVRNFSGMYAQP